MVYTYSNLAYVLPKGSQIIKQYMLPFPISKITFVFLKFFKYLSIIQVIT